MRKVFRHLIGELNGEWIKSIYVFLNNVIEEYAELFAYFTGMVFKLGDEDLSGDEIPIREEDMRGIATIAGVFTPFITAESNAGSIKFTDSKRVGDREYSERGLYNMVKERFDYFRTNTYPYVSDITTLATSALRASFVPVGAPILGYIEEGVPIFNEDGTVITENILATPPVGKAYYPYYGDKYLFFAETFLIKAYIDAPTFKKMFESFQRMRYSNPSIYEFAYITQLIMEDYVTNVYFEEVGNRRVVHYTLDGTSALEKKVKKTYIWKLLAQLKFPQFVLEEDL